MVKMRALFCVVYTTGLCMQLIPDPPSAWHSWLKECPLSFLLS